MYQRALLNLERVGEKQFEQVVRVSCRLGMLYMRREKFEEAEKMLKSAFDDYTDALGPQAIPRLNMTVALAGMYQRRGQLEKAQTMLELAARKFHDILGANSGATLVTGHALSMLYHLQGAFQQAVVIATFVIRVFETVSKLQHPTLRVDICLADMYADMGEWEKAEEMYSQAIKEYLSLSACRPDIVDVHRPILGMFHFYLKQERLDDARRLIERHDTVRILQAGLGSNDPGSIFAVLSPNELIKWQRNPRHPQSLHNKP
ncbi:hypothetical protein BBP40_004783 [Aspergillus hancockii]|nr:hypothetical protein BBP40_004783 [Aspergillus hancockii]